jgi:hypothetical protein
MNKHEFNSPEILDPTQVPDFIVQSVSEKLNTQSRVFEYGTGK